MGHRLGGVLGAWLIGCWLSRMGQFGGKIVAGCNEQDKTEKQDHEFPE
jgi:hypothetical protein